MLIVQLLYTVIIMSVCLILKHVWPLGQKNQVRYVYDFGKCDYYPFVVCCVFIYINYWKLKK